MTHGNFSTSCRPHGMTFAFKVGSAFADFCSRYHGEPYLRRPSFSIVNCIVHLCLSFVYLCLIRPGFGVISAVAEDWLVIEILCCPDLLYQGMLRWGDVLLWYFGDLHSYSPRSVSTLRCGRVWLCQLGKCWLSMLDPEIASFIPWYGFLRTFECPIMPLNIPRASWQHWK